MNSWPGDLWAAGNMLERKLRSMIITESSFSFGGRLPDRWLRETWRAHLWSWQRHLLRLSHWHGEEHGEIMAVGIPAA